MIFFVDGQTLTLQQMGTHLLQDQMNVQEQVLQYQFVMMIENVSFCSFPYGRSRYSRC